MLRRNSKQRRNDVTKERFQARNNFSSDSCPSDVAVVTESCPGPMSWKQNASLVVSMAVNDAVGYSGLMII